MDLVKPMLAKAATAEQIADLLEKGYLLASPKIDGIRCTIQNGIAYSRSLKPIPNKHVQYLLGQESFNGLDGELTIGSVTAHDVYRTTVKGIMCVSGNPNFTFHVFDNCQNSATYQHRRPKIKLSYTDGKTIIYSLDIEIIFSMDDLHNYEKKCLCIGYEGVILRGPTTKYKHGRSTVKSGALLKVKRFVDAEAVIIGTIELMHNANEATINELGYTSRSSHTANKVGKDTLGALCCEMLETGIEFNIGTGFDADTRQELWDCREDLPGKLVKYKYFPIGIKNAPRHPVFLGIRDVADV